MCSGGRNSANKLSRFTSIYSFNRHLLGTVIGAEVGWAEIQSRGHLEDMLGVTTEETGKRAVKAPYRPHTPEAVPAQIIHRRSRVAGFT